jgi:hypothetical protein
MHRPAHGNVTFRDIVENEMLGERTEDDEKTPSRELGMSKDSGWSKLGVQAEKPTGGFDGGKVLFRHWPARMDDIPLELAFHIRNEQVRFEDAHDAVDEVRARTL